MKHWQDLQSGEYARIMGNLTKLPQYCQCFRETYAQSNRIMWTMMVFHIWLHCWVLHSRGSWGHQTLPGILWWVQKVSNIWEMPFGLMSVPTCFNNMIEQELGDLKDTLFELFINNGGMASNEFSQHITDIFTLLNWVCNRKLLLSASKTKLFMTEVVFVGATVEPDGIKPDLTKLTTVIDWQQPTDLSNLEYFLGLTGHFQHLIQDYSRITTPLTDLKQ